MSDKAKIVLKSNAHFQLNLHSFHPGCSLVINQMIQAQDKSYKTCLSVM